MSTFHDPNCSGCPRCSELARAILANPTNPVLIEAMGNTKLRALAESALRTNVAMDSDDGDIPAFRTLSVDERRLTPPDPYAAGLAKVRSLDDKKEQSEKEQLRAMSEFRQEFSETTSVSRMAARVPATSEVHLNPPDGYALALQKRREQLGGRR